MLWIRSPLRSITAQSLIFPCGLIVVGYIVELLWWIDLWYLQTPNRFYSLLKHFDGAVFQSVVCYVKATLPRVLELLNAHFRYTPGSGSAMAVASIQNLILNIYSQHCIPSLNEELEVCAHSWVCESWIFMEKMLNSIRWNIERPFQCDFFLMWDHKQTYLLSVDRVTLLHYNMKG